MKKKYFLLILLLLHQVTFSQTRNIPEEKTQKGFAKLDFLSIKMPIAEIPNEPNMGLTGIHYNLQFNNLLYTGVGIYGAVSGSRGGFFTLGVNAGIKKYFSNQFYIDTGFHFGGGGGASAKDGGGAFILPHLNLGYQFKKISLHSGWSAINFFDKGLIKGNQINIAVEIPLDFNYVNHKHAEEEIDIENLKHSIWNKKTKKNSLMVHFNNLTVLSEAKATTGDILKGKTIKLAGFELASYYNNNWFYFLKVDGAYDGIRAGYMDVFLGGGYLLSLYKNSTNISAKLSIGAGGGGGVDTKGGFLLSPNISIEQRFLKDLFITINKGFLLTPNKHFYTSTLGFGIKYYMERNGIQSTTKNFSLGKLKGFGIVVKQDLYFNAKRETNPTENLHQISFQINVDMNKHVFIAGQTSFANFGNAGAYAEGLIGLGIKTRPFFKSSTTIFSQFLGGAAGGGNIDTGQGLIIKPSLGVNYQLSKTLNLRTSMGYVKAIKGKLSNPFINLGVSYNFSFLKLKKGN